jgi:predicted alpha/beta superfamily hydrolase
MRIKIACLFSSLIMVLATVAQLPQTVSGKIDRIDSFPSKFVTARNVDVWVPDDYSNKKTYAVLYMHDGQMLFDNTTTWNKKAWDVDDMAVKLMKQGTVKEFIVVGVWNGGPTRHPDYFPQKPFQSLNKAQQDWVVKDLQNAGRTKEVFQPVSDNYLKFLVTELKPFIDKHYATKKDRQNTFIAGSSMGGLISMYAICEYPQVFGGAACLSTHWPGVFSMNNNPVPDAFLSYLKTHLPNPKTHLLYFDHGTATLDAMYPAFQKKADEIILAKGYGPNNFLSKIFPGEDHSETAWSKRLQYPLEFLLGVR